MTFREWIQMPANQGIVGVIIAIIGIAVSLVAYFYPRTEEKTVTSHFVVCSSEYERACPTHDSYIYCYVAPEPVAAKSCKKYKQINYQTGPANKCGYSVWTYLCTNDAP